MKTSHIENPLKFCVVTGTRAEYGLLNPLLRRLKKMELVELQIIATAMHLSPQYGMTVRELEADGFTPTEKIEMLLSGDGPGSVTKSMGVGLIGFADSFARLKPDLVILLGDRTETFVAAQAAFIARIPIAHLHGGETTEGAIDDGIRHAITKLSSFHFVAAEPYRKRVIQLGESPDSVFNVGAIGLDNILTERLISRADLESCLGFAFGRSTLLVTYHPATLGATAPAIAMEELTAALESFPHSTIIFTKPNSDAGGNILSKMIDDFCHKHSGRAYAFSSLGHQRYLSLLREADVVVGNSSSGIIEAPAFNTPTVNIGDRQKGRLSAQSVLHVGEDRDQITGAIRRALSPEFRESLREMKMPYGGRGDTAERIVEILLSSKIGLAGQKSFFDIEVAE